MKYLDWVNGIKVINIYWKYACAIPLNNKSGKTVALEFENVIKKSHRKPLKSQKNIDILEEKLNSMQKEIDWLKLPNESKESIPTPTKLIPAPRKIIQEQKPKIPKVKVK